MKTPTTWMVIGATAFALATASSFAQGDDEVDVGAAARKHFAAENGSPSAAPSAEDPTSSPAAMVSFFVSEPPPGVEVASRRHLDLDIKFAFDSAALDDKGIAELDVAGKALESPQLATRHFQLAGHTDDRGDTSYNLDLSRRRAESAKTYLVEHYDIDPDRLEAVGYGSERPRYTDDTPEARRANRRVVLELTQ